MRCFLLVRFLTRCSLFCLLWVGTNYMYIRSLRILLATDVMALFATNVSSVYLLSWVILHEQFVGIRVTMNLSLPKLECRYLVLKRKSVI